MRTSRISQETTKMFNASSPASATRRVTRSSLTKFTNPAKVEDKSSGPDIEDAVLPLRKRKRTATMGKPEPDAPTSCPDGASTTTSPRKQPSPRKPAREVTDPATGEVSVHPPSHWAAMYALVLEMRRTGSARNAAVDTMGCESQGRAAQTSARDRRYHTLTALMLSSQTKDTTNAAAMARLRAELPAHAAGAPAGLNLENVLAVEPALLNELIWAVGFHNNKTRYIKAAAEMLRDGFDGDIPDTVEGLLSLPGVGPKMAYLCMSSAWGRDEGIGVDVHVHRITNIWGWNGTKETRDPEQTRVMLQKWLPRELWHEINWLLVGLGQTVCLPVGRKCGECRVGEEGLCRGAVRAKVNEGRRIKKEKLEMEREDGVVVKTEVVKEVGLEKEVPVNAGEHEVVNANGVTKKEEEE